MKHEASNIFLVTMFIHGFTLRLNNQPIFIIILKNLNMSIILSIFDNVNIQDKGRTCTRTKRMVLFWRIRIIIIPSFNGHCVYHFHHKNTTLSKIVASEGFEPSLYRLVAECSIHSTKSVASANWATKP